MTTTPADPPLPHSERKAHIRKFSDQDYILVQCFESYADELHTLLESERSEHAKTREARDALFETETASIIAKKLSGVQAERDALAAKVEKAMAVVDVALRWVEAERIASSGKVFSSLGKECVAQGFIDRDGRRLETAGKEGK